MSIIRQLLVSILILGLLSAFSSAEEKDSSIRILNTSEKGVQKTEVGVSMVGPRDTLVFFKFIDQNAVLVVNVDNKTKKFAVTATVYLFALDVTEKGLAKWINNQHSDGLYPDIPKPIAIHKIDLKHCSMISHERVDSSKDGFKGYDSYTVKYGIADVKKKGVFELKAFTAEASVWLKTR